MDAHKKEPVKAEPKPVATPKPAEGEREPRTRPAAKPERFTPGPGPDDPSVAYDGGFDRGKGDDK